MSLMNTQYDSIMRMYAARQARSRQEYEARMEQIQKDIPELSALEADITTCQAALVRSAVEDAPSRPSFCPRADVGGAEACLRLPGLSGHRLHRRGEMPLLSPG